MENEMVSGEEESGWTMYFDDYFNYQNNNDDCDEEEEMVHDQSYLISDAASSSSKKILNNNNLLFPIKKRKNKASAAVADNDDDDLVDTASSPANSPKVYQLINQLDRQSYQHNNVISHSQENVDGLIVRNKVKKGGRSRYDSNSKEQVGDEEENKDSSGLKKRGLCLVPLSMVVNYI